MKIGFLGNEESDWALQQCWACASIDKFFVFLLMINNSFSLKEQLPLHSVLF